MPEIQILRGSKINNIPTKSQIPSTGQSQPGIVGRTLLTGLRGLEAPLHGISSLLQYLGEPGLIRNQTTSQDVMQKLGIQESQLEPQSFPETVLHKFAQTAPLALVGGGFPAVARSAFGAIPAAGLKEAGAPESIQDLAQLGSEVGLGLYQGRVPTIPRAQKIQYELAKKAIPEGKQYISKPLTQAIFDVEKNLGTEVNESIHKKITHALETIDKHMSGGTSINPSTALDLRKKLYQYRRTLPKEGQPYIDSLTKGINDFFGIYSAENPEFFKHLKTADKLTEIKHMGSIINQGIDKLREFAPAKLGNLGLIFKPAGYIEKLGRSLIKEPVARKHYFEAAKAAAQEDYGSFIRNLTNLIPEKEREEIQSPKSNIKVLRGHKI